MNKDLRGRTALVIGAARGMAMSRDGAINARD